MQKKENTIKILIRRVIIFKNFLIYGIKVIAASGYWHNKAISKVLLLSVLVNLSMWLYLFVKRINGDFPIILHYNLFFGVDSVGVYEKIYLLPLVGILIIIVNSALGHFFYKIERLASYLLTLNILIVQVVLMLSSYLIIRANF